MTTTKHTGKPVTRYGPSVLAIVVLGGLLGYLFSGDIFIVPVQALVISYVLGVVWAFLFLEWTDIVSQRLAFFSNPIPVDLDLARGGHLQEHLKTLKAHKGLVSRSKNLLGLWQAGSSPRALLALADFQSRRASAQSRSGAVFVVLLLIPCLWYDQRLILAWGGLALLGLTIYTRQSLLTRVDQYLEEHLLRRLPAELPGTTVSATELGRILGGAIEDAFKNYIPQPGRMAETISNAVDSVSKETTGQVEKLQGSFVENQTALLDKWADTEKQTLDRMDQTRQALQDIVSQIERTASADKMEQALKQHAQKIGAAGDGWKEQLESVLTTHANNIHSTTEALANQLNVIAELEKQIQGVLHIQEVVDGTLKSISSAEEVKDLFAALRTHLEESDKLLREVAKPRTIRLIETEGEIKEEAPASPADTTLLKPDSGEEPDSGRPC